MKSLIVDEMPRSSESDTTGIRNIDAPGIMPGHVTSGFKSAMTHYFVGSPKNRWASVSNLSPTVEM